LLKIQGTNNSSQLSNGPINIILKNGTTEISNQILTSSSASNNTVQVNLGPIPNGIYDIYITPWAHLTKKFTTIHIATGAVVEPTIIDLTSQNIIAGNFWGNNNQKDNIEINGLDLGKALIDYCLDPFDLTICPSNSPADINLDNKVNGLDLGFILMNYLQEGDQ